MDEVIGLFPIPVQRSPGVLPRGLVDALVAHFSAQAVQDNSSSPNLSHTRLLKPADSPLLVARAAALVRILRGGRPCELCFMPPSCKRLSKDEAELMRLLAIARRQQPGELESVICQFVGSARQDAATRAVNALALC